MVWAKQGSNPENTIFRGYFLRADFDACTNVGRPQNGEKNAYSTGVRVVGSAGTLSPPNAFMAFGVTLGDGGSPLACD